MKPIKSHMLAYIKHQHNLRDKMDVMEYVDKPVTEIIWNVKQIDTTEYWLMLSRMQLMGHKMVTPFDCMINRWEDAKKMHGWWTVEEHGTIYQAEQAVVLGSPPEHKLTFYHFRETGDAYWVLTNHSLELGVEVMEYPIRFRPVSQEYIEWTRLRVWRKDE